MEEKLTLQDLAKLGKTYWRFSQSEKGRSQENCFAKYLPSQITVAEKGEKLSFASEDTIAVCFMYGDILTKLNFDITDTKFKEIMNCKVYKTGNILGEYQSEKLLTEENYSLKEISTIKKIFSMVKDDWQIVRIFSYENSCGEDFVGILKKFGFGESASLVACLKSRFLKNNCYISKEEIMHLIEEYITEKAN